MNILIVSENFLNGGLETQINSTVQSLKEKANFFFAFKNYNEKWNYENVYTDFYFSYSCTVYQFCHDVDALVQIIKENNIDVIHAHPFYSLFPAIFAAKICGKPIVYTYHGIGSYNFTATINDSLLFNMLSDYEIDKIFCVSTEGNKIFENITFEKNKIFFLPNSINLEMFRPTKITNNKSWALISRLDDDKINEITKIINILDFIDIKELHIFGDGAKKEFLTQYIIQNHLTNKVFLEGHCDNLQEKLSKEFNGVFGIGRVAMESISMEFPTILIGFSKIAGLIDSKMYNFIKDKNFTNKYLPNVSVETLKKQIQDVYSNTYDKTFYKLFKQDFSTQTVSDTYLKELKNINYSCLLNLNDLYSEIQKTDNDAAFYSCISIYELIRKYFAFYIRQPHQKSLFLFGDSLLTQKKINDTINNQINIQNSQLTSQIDIQTNNLNNQISDKINVFKGLVKNKFVEQEKKINNLSEHSMTYSNFKRKLKYKFNKK